ncbi:anaphase promoting complex subunit CDC23 RNJ42_02382 [Nakaseomyces bracarensis]|uniref:anaphase promoting complex subunit CDC23 n=1 Tax=Nakaseomyces bracarensis TaxID=273131 RepID=UPI003871B4FF
MAQVLSDDVVADVRRSLRKAADEMGKMKLVGSAKWASEALNGICEDGKAGGQRRSVGAQESDHFYFTENEYDQYLYISTLFDGKEFDRCAFWLKDVVNPALKFLQLYCQFLSWDKRHQETLENVLTVSRKASIVNNGSMEKGIELDGADEVMLEQNPRFQRDGGGEGKATPDSIVKILEELNSYLDAHMSQRNPEVPTNSIGFALLFYLRGILLKQGGSKSAAMKAFIHSLKIYSYNYACWTELLDCITTTEEAHILISHMEKTVSFEKLENLKSQASLENNIMYKVFQLLIFKEFQGNVDEYLELFEYLLTMFPNFIYLHAQNALTNYQYMDYTHAESLFEKILEVDPYRLDDLDTYSNILYVMQKNSKLAYLTQFVAGVDRFRPETCCVIANYYSARQEHEKSIMYFRRALTLDKRATSAWTLMGHEFVELKNSHAAIESYRRAVDIDPKDFRAWYGLGQAYEVLDMHLYSLYYFQRACILKPLDMRMWQALGSCYAKVSNQTQAIKCFERALQLTNKEQDTSLLFKLAKLYEQVQNIDKCKCFMEKCVEMEHITEGLVTEESVKARLWLAKYEFNNKNYDKAYNFAVGVSSGTSQEIEEARSLARDCRRNM